MATLTDAGKRLDEDVKTFSLDAVAPVITLQASLVKDERGDTIDFATGEPVHTHDGEDIDLASGSCPAVYKYAYLMDSSAPAFGRQTAPNPLAWKLTIADVQVIEATYRVRNAAIEILLDWMPLADTGSGSYAVELHRDVMPKLGEYEGQLFIDIRASDWGSLESTTTLCWEHHLLAAPLELDTVQQATGTESLFSWSLATDSSISSLMGIGLGARIAEARIVQHTSEPIVFSGTIAATAVRYTKTVVDDHVVTASVTTTIGPGEACSTTNGCDVPAPTDPLDPSSSGSVTNYSLTLLVWDDVANTYLLTTSIPGRTTGEAPHAYRLLGYVSQLPDLQPDPSAVIGEYSLTAFSEASRTYTGVAPGSPLVSCSDQYERCTSYGCAPFCRSYQTYRRIIALDKATLELDNVAMTFTTSPNVAVPTSAPANAPQSNWVLGNLVWNAGDDDLPGPK